MRIEQITESEMREAGVVSLSNRPSSPYAYGGDGLSPTALKERFDRLPRLVAERLNLLLEGLAAMPELSDLSGGSIAEWILTGMFPEENAGHTLAELLRDLLDGTAAGYLTVGGRSLGDALDGKESRARVSKGGAEVQLDADSEVRCGKVSELTVALPDLPEEGYGATLVFDTEREDGATAVYMPSGVRWSGDDVVDGAFVPLGGRHYTCIFWYDGAYQAVVRGVKNEA